MCEIIIEMKNAVRGPRSRGFEPISAESISAAGLRGGRYLRRPWRPFCWPLLFLWWPSCPEPWFGLGLLS